jgi:hypothetical protein
MRRVVLGSLVDVRNLDARKAVRLTIEVPADLAVQVMDAFGWPTRRAPVPVEVVRMVETIEQKDIRSLAQQAGAMCTNAIFQAFMECSTEEECAQAVREACDVGTRAEIRAGTMAGEQWLDLLERFRGWEAAERVGASNDD